MDLGISSSGGEKKWQFDQWQGRRFYDITPSCRPNENNNNNNNNNNNHNDNNHYYHHLCSVRVAQNTTTRGPRKKNKTKQKQKKKPKKLETNKIAM